MTYRLEFKKQALREWRNLDPVVQVQFKTKLAERLLDPHVPSAKIRGGKNLHKIKLRQVGYRLVYEVNNKVVTVTVLAVGKRDRKGVYLAALGRL